MAYLFGVLCGTSLMIGFWHGPKFGKWVGHQFGKLNLTRFENDVLVFSFAAGVEAFIAIYAAMSGEPFVAALAGGFFVVVAMLFIFKCADELKLCATKKEKDNVI